ncbi:MAG: leucyl aminopeptidase [Clostridia bacterium]|nr:leucyl aminopeptidase [Clostridia bacterium]
MKDVRMARGAATIVNKCTKIRPGEQVVIVTEAAKMSIAETLAEAVVAAGAEPEIIAMIPRERDGQEPPAPIAAAMKTADVFFCVVGKSITHTNAVKDAGKEGARGLVLTHFTEEMMYKGGITADFPAIAPICKAIAATLAGSEEVHLTTTFGTDLRYSARGRRGNALYGVVEPGQFSTIPTIEANVSPLEGTANGTIVANASVPYLGIGVLKEPVRCEVKDGIITSMTGGEQAMALKADLDAKGDPMVYNVAEMGIGLNPECRFCGFMLEDEGVCGSVHIGIGTSITLGGVVKTACHYDLIMTGATVVADGKTLIDNGRVCTENLGLE